MATKTIFLGVLLVQVQSIKTGTCYGLEILHKCGKRIETTGQTVYGAISYVCRSFRGKLVGWSSSPPPHPPPLPILNRVNSQSKLSDILPQVGGNYIGQNFFLTTLVEWSNISFFKIRFKLFTINKISEDKF